MWTPTTRRRYSRTGLRYASDLTDAEWALIEPLAAGGLRARAAAILAAARNRQRHLLRPTWRDRVTAGYGLDWVTTV